MAPSTKERDGPSFGAEDSARAIYLLPAPPEEAFTSLEKAFPEKFDCFGQRLRSYIFTDGSGGSTGSDRRRRRCGWSVVQIDESGRAIGILTGSIGGPIQTVPRAELVAVIKALDNIPDDMTLWSDCKYVVDGMHKLQFRPDKPLPKKNRTLWIEARRLLSARANEFIIHKMLAHTTHKDVKDGKLSAWERLGNHVADKYAGDAAERYALDSRLLERLDELDTIASDVLRRLVAINLDICAKYPGGKRRPRSKTQHRYYT